MKKILWIALSVLVVLGVFSGCSKQPDDTASAAEVMTIESGTEEEAVPTDTPAEVPAEVPAGTPENISPTTGLENTTTIYKPVIVQLGNEAYERPQTGIQLADVVYEVPIEDPDTRLTAVFNDVLWTPGAPDEINVGAVRSTRYYHQWIQSEWDALYVHMGGPDKTGNPISDVWGESSKHVKQRINGAGTHSVNSGMFSQLKPGKSVADYAATDLVADAKIYNYEPKQRKPFTYYPLEDYADKKEIKEIGLSFVNKKNYVEFEYDKATDKLTRFVTGKGRVQQMDDATGEPLTVQNLIVQYTTITPMPDDDPIRKYVDVFGKGPAEFIIHGKHITGTWERKDETVATTYKDDTGKEIVLTPGNTWIAVHPNNTQVEIQYADGTDYKTNA